MEYLRTFHGVIHRDKARNCEIHKTLNVEPLLRRERSQLRLFGHVSRMSQERLSRLVLLAKPTGKRLRCRPRPRWSNCISDLVWSHLGVEPAELSEIAIGRAVFRILLGLLSPRPSPEEKRAWKVIIGVCDCSNPYPARSYHFQKRNGNQWCTKRSAKSIKLKRDTAYCLWMYWACLRTSQCFFWLLTSNCLQRVYLFYRSSTAYTLPGKQR